MFKTKYRVVTDNYLGYEAQFKLWWFPIWLALPHCGKATNTFSSLESAKNLISKHVARDSFKSEVVYYD